MAKTLTLRVDDRTYRAFRAAAEADRRSVANWIELAARSWLERSQFADDAEMEGILSNRPLQRRLKEGLRDAARRRGRWVD